MSKNSKKFILIGLVVIVFSGVLFQPVLANNIGDALSILDDKIIPQTNITGSDLPQKDLAGAVGFWIGIGLLTVGIIFFLLMFYGGMLWFTSRGEEEHIKKAKELIIAAMIGIMIVISSYAISTLVTNNLVVEQKGGIGDKATEAVGCCVDWVGIDALTVPIATCRMTTKFDCKQQGSVESSTDAHAGEEGEGTWTWDGTILDFAVCNVKCGG